MLVVVTTCIISLPNGLPAQDVLFWLPVRRTLVLVTDVQRIGMSQLKATLESLDARQVQHLHLVSRWPLSTQQQNLNTAIGTHLRVILWNLVLLYPMDHHLVPRHRRATESDLALLPRGWTLRNLPGIPLTDPVIQTRGPMNDDQPAVGVSGVIVGHGGSDRPRRRLRVLPRGDCGSLDCKVRGQFLSVIVSNTVKMGVCTVCERVMVGVWRHHIVHWHGRDMRIPGILTDGSVYLHSQYPKSLLSLLCLQ